MDATLDSLLNIGGQFRLGTQRTPLEHVVHVAKLYHRGVICPTETWKVIYEGTKHLNVVELFDTLEISQQDWVRCIHRERPGSLEHLADSNPDSQFPSMLAWCVDGLDS